MNKSVIKVILCLAGLSLTLVTSAATITISPYLPGSLSSVGSAGPGAFVKNFYQYALFISGILAFGAIVYGGIRYAMARGNPSGETEAKAWIWSALLGLLLLAGAYLILYTVNPNLVNLKLPTLPNAPAPAQQTVTGQQGTVQCGGTTNGVCPAGQVCQPNGGTYSCQSTSSFDCGIPPNHPGSCSGTQSCVRTDNDTTNKNPTYGCHT